MDCPKFELGDKTIELPDGSKEKAPDQVTWECTKEAVKRRDEYKCKGCGSVKELEVHHILEREFGGTDNVRNLITLCTKCHDVMHNKILRKQFIEIVQGHVNEKVWNKWTGGEK